MACENNNTQIVQIPDDCNGKRISTDCITYSSAITLLDLPPNSSNTEVINALVLAINSLIGRIELLETITTDHENRITILEP